MIGTQLYFTSVEQRYKHGGHVVRAFLAGTKNVFCTFPSSDVSNDEANTVTTADRKSVEYNK